MYATKQDRKALGIFDIAICCLLKLTQLREGVWLWKLQPALRLTNSEESVTLCCCELFLMPELLGYLYIIHFNVNIPTVSKTVVEPVFLANHLFFFFF